MLVCAFSVRYCTRDRGCSAHPVFPAPSVFEGDAGKPRTQRNRAARMRHRIFHRHRPRRRAIQYSRGSSDRTDKPRRTGYPAFAGHDGSVARRYFIVIADEAKSRSPDERSDIRGHSHTAYSTVIAREGGRSSIPETPLIESSSRGVLDTPPSRGMTVQWRVGISSSLLTKRSLVARMSAATSGATLTLHIPPSSPAKAGDPVFQRQQ